MEPLPIDQIPDRIADAVIADLRRRLDEVGVVADLSAARHAEAAVLRTRLEAVLAARRSEVAALRRRIAELEALLAQRAGSAAPAPSQPERSGADLAADPGAAESYADLARGFTERLAERSADITRRYEERISMQLGALEEKDEQIGHLTERLSAALREADELRAGAEPPPDPHDLQRIGGIGPVIAGTLRDIGITTIQEVAALTDEDLDRIDEHLDAFRGRSRRDRWVEQARRLIAAR